MITDADHPGAPIKSVSSGPGGSRKKNVAVVHLKKVCKILANDKGEHARFPGSQPISLMSNHLQSLKESSYFVCEKSDGVRYLLLIHDSQRVDTAKYAKVFLVNRKFEFVPIKGLDILFESENGKKYLEYMNNTLLDGELVIDEIQLEDGTHKKQAMFLVFDAINIRRKFVGDLDLFDRLRVAQAEGVSKFQELMAALPEEARINMPFFFTLKQMYRKEDVGFVLDRIIPELPHENDGLIFTRVDLPFKIGTCDGILKWKPKHMNSVDFELQVKWMEKSQDDLSQERKYCQLFSARRGSPFPYGWINLTDEQQNTLMEKYKSKSIVIEVTLDDDTPGMNIPSTAKSWDQIELTSPPGWKFMRVREDKRLGNDINTVERVIESINSGITGEYLSNFLGVNKGRPNKKQKSKP